MVLQHFGLKHYPLGKAHTQLWDDGFLARLDEATTPTLDWLREVATVVSATALAARQGRGRSAGGRGRAR